MDSKEFRKMLSAMNSIYITLRINGEVVSELSAYDYGLDRLDFMEPDCGRDEDWYWENLESDLGNNSDNYSRLIHAIFHHFFSQEIDDGREEISDRYLNFNEIEFSENAREFFPEMKSLTYIPEYNEDGYAMDIKAI